MSEALRSLLAEFVVSVDKAGELAKGNAAVDALKARLGELQAEFAKVKAPAELAGKAIREALTPDDIVKNAIGAAHARLRNSDAIGHLQGGGGSGGDGFLGAGLGAGRVTQFGPTRDTLNAANKAASDYAKTLRGRLVAAVAEVRKGFAGGGSGSGGGGLIGSLATVRNGLIALGVGTAIRSVKHLVDGIGDISEGAARLGVTTDEFQRLSALAKINATDVGTLGTAFRNLATSAVDPSKETTAAFAQLGISVKDGAGQFKTSQDLFFETGEALAGVTNETVRTQLAQKLLGRSAIELKPLFAQGTLAFRKQREEMLKLKVLSPEVIAAADELSDSWAILGTQLLAAAGPVLRDVLFPALKALTAYLTKGIEWLGKFVKHTDFVASGLTALAYVVTASLIPALIGVVTRGIAASGSMLAFGASATKAAWSFARLILGLLLLQDFIGFLRGDDSEIGDVLDKLFGKGASAGVVEALAKAWDLVASAVKRVLEALHLFKPDDLDLEQRGRADAAYEGSNFQSKIFPALKGFADAVIPGLGTLAGAGVDRLTSGTSSSDYGMSTIPAPGAAGGGEASMSLAPNVSIGDSVVNITMGPSATAADVGSAVSSVQERGRDAILASYPQ